MTIALSVLATNAQGETINFDQERPGALPADWIAGVTGSGKPRWTIEADPAASSPANVLRQSGSGDFPWCVRKGVLLGDGFVEVRFKPLAGKDDQAGGVIWRWQDGDNYYVARGNALEKNVSLYYTEAGRRKTLKYVDAPIAANVWHTLRAEFAGVRLRVLLDGKVYIEMEDTHITAPGSVGVWTKADSITAFDDFGYGAMAR